MFCKIFFFIFYCNQIYAQDLLKQCRLPNRAPPHNVAIGFPKVSNRARSTGTLTITVLFVDFSDMPATQTVEQVFSLISPTTENFYSKNSYNNFKINFLPYFKWLRMSKRSTDYGMSPSISFNSQRAYITEAANIARGFSVDFSTSDEIVVLTNPLVTAVPYGPAFCSQPGSGVTINGREIINGANSGYDINNWKEYWLIHELGHTLGLVDLYAFSGDLFRFTGGWSIMGNINGFAREFLAWERWLMGWLPDSQIKCVSDSSSYFISPIENLDNLNKMLIVPLSSTSAVVVESRRSSVYDNLEKEGILVYFIDTSVASGSGPIQILPIDYSDTDKRSAILAVGESVKYISVTVTYLNQGTITDEVKIVSDVPIYSSANSNFGFHLVFFILLWAKFSIILR